MINFCDIQKMFYITVFKDSLAEIEKIITGDYMEMPHEMNTLSEAMTVLRSDGYTKDFQMGKDGLVFKDSEKVYKPNELSIKKLYRFEGMSDPADMSVVYAIETNDGSKGIYIDAFGTYSDHDPLTVADFFNKVKIENEHGDH